ncbi:TetR family transcriptional regulator [Janibacter cremeus]|uniref:AcrR family transcriptional regulator n=1 Tax=Janibacter cremeus TaxID=1285192 RepID=A0A852VQW0_9MICO|nr:AcrR family transcriptional regulator [Janibacter cremeus]
MTNSAMDSRRTAIIAAAQRLAVSCGYSGFTFDDLAQAVGVSRRTLFNHVSSKEEAVLGMLPVLTDEQTETLRAGGPTGDLVQDLVITAIDSLGGDDATAQDWQQLQAVIRRNPELLVRVQDHVDELGLSLVTHLAARDGVGEEQARVVFTVVGGLIGRAVQDLIDSPAADLQSGGLTARVHHNLALARELLATRR